MFKHLKKLIFTTLLMSSVIASPAMSKEKLLVGTDTAFVPFEFKQNGKYVGFDIDLWDAVAKKIGVDYELRPMNFSGLIPAVQSKNIDVAIAGITITDARKKAVDMTDGYYNADFLIAVPSSTVDIEKFQDLKGKKIGLKQGTGSVNYMKKNVKAKYVLFPEIDNAYLDLQSGNLDAVVHDSPNIMYYVKVAGKGKIKVAGLTDSAEPQQYGFALTKNSPYTSKINKAFADLKADGTYRKIYMKWFDQEPK